MVTMGILQVMIKSHFDILKNTKQKKHTNLQTSHTLNMIGKHSLLHEMIDLPF